MPQKFAFTTAAMSAALEETSVSYEDLADIEKEFDDVETEIIRQQIALTKPLYERRSKTISQIPNFWPLVLEQAPPDIDQYIQPSDSALLLSSLLSISVSHFEVESDTPGGDPRSVSVTWEFAPNDYFHDEKLEKKFWYRRARDGWCGLVSEPVEIRWKEGRDLTGGLLGLVCKAWEAEKKTGSLDGDSKSTGKAKKEGLTAEQKVLKRKIENTGMGGLSFFAWFGFIGRKVSEEESQEATRLEKEKREKRKASKSTSEAPSNAEEDQDQDEEDEDEDDEEDIDMSLEIFPDGDDLAVALTEDLWPGAIKYFTQAQEQDALSDADFESDDEEEEGGDANAAEGSADDSEGENEDRPKKKQRSS
ncbi:hypothetical protein ONS95_008881 [Cadophora gregata]|uniref:uncharacterized protein n=1 Tax=Cadophora gregata TaxID=51156 RepID=UPI0026DB3749|nr:uncharacterized protein ONS95_008881 [Cadophora gregata]KAK0123888.1 hypothetical protein ONS95_008881 [Cadophora gregata]KAK0130229.1 hypothetical protein ONS96_000752 [Cadophora gregata f. sp. sojae]